MEDLVIVFSRTRDLADTLANASGLKNLRVLWHCAEDATAWAAQQFPEAVIVCDVSDDNETILQDLRRKVTNTLCRYSSEDPAIGVQLGEHVPDSQLAQMVALLALRQETRALRKTWSTVFGSADTTTEPL